MSEMDLKTVALLIYQAIFADEESVEIEYKIYPIEKTRASKMRYVKLGGYTFLEQNPFDMTPWGKEENGHPTIWVMKGRTAVARVRDGRYKNIPYSGE
ncbi:MAG: hypothetical protein HXS40_13875 [Theionarchaea archaeon]|nr:hypothetical protein [Theionarchaea archaeon]